jgi:hypothetical protein
LVTAQILKLIVFHQTKKAPNQSIISKLIDVSRSIYILRLRGSSFSTIQCKGKLKGKDMHHLKLEHSEQKIFTQTFVCKGTTTSFAYLCIQFHVHTQSYEGAVRLQYSSLPGTLAEKHTNRDRMRLLKSNRAISTSNYKKTNQTSTLTTSTRDCICSHKDTLLTQETTKANKIYSITKQQINNILIYSDIMKL